MVEFCRLQPNYNSGGIPWAIIRRDKKGFKKVNNYPLCTVVHFPQSPKQLFCAPLQYSNFVSL